MRNVATLWLPVLSLGRKLQATGYAVLEGERLVTRSCNIFIHCKFKSRKGFEF